jgi:DNA polymerase III gamma/tau subunit
MPQHNQLFNIVNSDVQVPEKLHLLAAISGFTDAGSAMQQVAEHILVQLLYASPPTVDKKAVPRAAAQAPQTQVDLKAAEHSLKQLPEAPPPPANQQTAKQPLELLESCRTLLERGREPTAVLQGLAGLLRDLVLAGVAPDRLELSGFSPQFRGQLPELAQRIGTPQLLRWQAQLKGSEQQLRQSINPRLWLEVLLLGLLAEPPQQVASAAAAVSAATCGRMVVEQRNQAQMPNRHKRVRQKACSQMQW